MATIEINATEKNAERAFVMIRARLRSLFDLFEEPGVTEVNLNGPNNAWIVKFGHRERALITDIDEITASSAVRELASSMGQEAIASTTAGNVDAKMPGFRFSAVLSPVASNGTILSIRKHSPRTLSLSNYVNDGQFDQKTSDLISQLVKDGKNILIGGSTDSGKTTFLNALSREIPLTDRVLTIEDTRELSLVVDNWVAFETNEQKGVTATELLKTSMRHSPDRIICGELRKGDAWDFLASCNTGHGGSMTTIHCTSASKALRRMQTLCLLGVDIPLIAIQASIAESIEYVFHFKKFSDGKRRLSEIVEVLGFDPDTTNYRTKSIFNYQESV
jgi:pilus assembly protein CpaF